jgi:hypothetical protein
MKKLIQKTSKSITNASANTQKRVSSLLASAQQKLKNKKKALQNSRKWQALVFRKSNIKAALWFSLIFLIIRIITWYLTTKGVLTSDWNFWDPLLSMVTLLTALFVWFGESSEDWEEQLKMRLTVFFTYKGKLLMLGEQFPLVNAADIRALAQQIGSQMAQRSQLEMNLFSMKIEQDAPQNEVGIWYKDFYLTIELSDLPSKDPKKPAGDPTKLEFEGHFRDENYKYWSANQPMEWFPLYNHKRIAEKVKAHGAHFFCPQQEK